MPLPARRIFANPGTITGSIGVIMEFANFQELLREDRPANEVVKSGEHKDIGSPIRPMTEADRQILQAMIDDVHEPVYRCGRPKGANLSLRRCEVLPTAGSLPVGRHWPPVWSMNLAICRMPSPLPAELGGIDGEPDVVYPPGKQLATD